MPQRHDLFQAFPEYTKFELEDVLFSDSVKHGLNPIAANATVTAAIPGEIQLTAANGADYTNLFTLTAGQGVRTTISGFVVGQTYTVAAYGSGAVPIQDTLLRVRNQALTLLQQDDDGGTALGSLITFTATETSHVFDMFDFGGAAAGNIRLDIVGRPAGDVVGDLFATSSPISQGVSYGFIDAGVPSFYGPPLGETDTFSFTVEAGKYYRIDVAGGADYNSNYAALTNGELDPWIFVYNTAGIQVAESDDIDFPDDISSSVFFLAQTSGTYYLDVQSYTPWTGGFQIMLEEVDTSNLGSPLDAISWFSADNIDTVNNVAKVYFGAAGETFGETGQSFGWNATEKAAVMSALLEFTKITGIVYEETNVVGDAEFRLFTTTSTQFGAYFYPQDAAYGTQQGIGAFNVNSGGWGAAGQGSLAKGGFAYAVILHEFGHAHGLAHPHDNGGGSDIMPGVSSSTGTYGVFDLNQGVYTVMSYNDAWPLHPTAPSAYSAATRNNGWNATLSAFDIAVLQDRYGVHAYATGNSVYTLKDVQAAGTQYETIWDTGGTDEIRYDGNSNARIDLTPATLDYSPTGGGALSYIDNIRGGFTIANGVVIERAFGGGGNDVIIGNAAANYLVGNGGADTLAGGAGADFMWGGDGTDTVSYMNAAAGITLNLANAALNTGDAAGDTFSAIEKYEGSKFDDNMTGGGNADFLSGLDGNDTLSGGLNNDTLNGGEGNDNANGGDGADTLNGDAGNDTLSGGNQNDVLNGGAGQDNLSGGGHDDTLNGGDDNDILDGGANNDTLNGGAGQDYLAGGTNNDVLDGGTGNDTMAGGAGNDIFVVSNTGDADAITDFVRGQDKINLTLIDAVAGGSDNAFTWVGSSAFSGVAGQLRAYSSGGANYLAGDVNGDSIADFTIQTNLLIIATDVVL